MRRSKVGLTLTSSDSIVLQPPPSAIFVIYFPMIFLLLSLFPSFNAADYRRGGRSGRLLLSRASSLLGNVVITELKYRSLSNHQKSRVDRFIGMSRSDSRLSLRTTIFFFFAEICEPVYETKMTDGSSID